MTSFANRMVLSAKLNPGIYEEVEADRSALGQALGVVVLASVAAGIGSAGRIGISGLFMGIVLSLAAWFIWAGLTYFIGTRILPEPQTRADYGQLLRTIGFAAAPGVLRILGVVPGLMTVIFVVAEIWMLAAMVIAVRQALDYRGTGRAVIVCLLGWVVQALFIALVVAVTGITLPQPAA
jgi:hypothetical protein